MTTECRAGRNWGDECLGKGNMELYLLHPGITRRPGEPRAESQEMATESLREVSSPRVLRTLKGCVCVFALKEIKNHWKLIINK